MIREIAVASGKGGTGKTFIASNLLYYISKYVDEKCVGVDADAEAPDLALALGDYVEIYSRDDVYESKKAVIDYEKCNLCLNCYNTCRFYAINIDSQGRPTIVEEYCEGCGACSLVCTSDAINYRVVKTGTVIFGKTRHGQKVVTADLEVSGRNTGHLVYIAREKAKSIPELKYVIIDSAPGIGCPVISSIVGSNLLIICVEPTEQSYNGCRRLIQVAQILKVDYRVIINKYDMNIEMSNRIEKEIGNNVIGRIPYSRDIVKSYADMIPIMATNSKIRKDLEEIFEEILKL